MKYFSFFLFLFLLVSCKKEEFIYNYPELNKLLVSVTRSGAQTEFRTEFKYDSLHRLIEVKNISPESQPSIESYAYDEENRIIEKRNRNYLTTYIYNADGQLAEQYIHYKSSDGVYEWNEKTAFVYRDGKIYRGNIYSSDGEMLRYITYKYDSRGNTLEKKEHVAGSDSDFGFIEIEFKYDTKVNPLGDSGLNMLNGYTFAKEADIKQINNPVYSSYMNMISSSLPPKFEISYEYDSDGLPVKAVLSNAYYPDQEPVTVVYEYIDIER